MILNILEKIYMKMFILKNGWVRYGNSFVRKEWLEEDSYSRNYYRHEDLETAYLMSKNWKKDKPYVYLSDEQIENSVSKFTKNINISGRTKYNVEFGFQEGIYHCIDILKKLNK